MRSTVTNGSQENSDGVTSFAFALIGCRLLTGKPSPQPCVGEEIKGEDAKHTGRKERSESAERNKRNSKE